MTATAAWIAALAASVAANDDRLVDLFGRVRSEGANLWSALGCSLEDGAIDVGVGVCRDLYNFWLADGGFSQVIGILRAFLERPEASERTRADALWVSALIYTTMADADAGRRAASEALAIGRALGADDIVAWARIGLASACGSRAGGTRRSRRRARSCGRPATGGLPYQELTALNILALAQRFGGDIDAAIATGYEAIALSERLGEIWLRGYALHFLAAASLRAGKVAEAERLARDGLEIRRDLGHVHGLGSLVEVLASVEIAKGDDERAATLLGGADAIWASISWRHTPANLKDHDAVRAGVLERLGRARYARAYAAGESMDRAQLVDFALGRAVQPRPDPATVRARPLLSPREMEVARLVADGASNAQVAGQLFIGERTVESHVASIFNKIGVDSRVQVARWVAALDDASTGH